MSKFLMANQAAAATSEIFLYGIIGVDVIDNEFVQKLKEVEKQSSTIKLRINSAGGSIFQGLAIFNAIKESPAEIHCYIDGMAASMGSVVALACKKVFMSNNSMFMTHPASISAFSGTANDMRVTAKLIDQLEEIICNIYASKTGLSYNDAFEKYLKGELWLTAKEALTQKIIDGIYDSTNTVSIAAQVRNPTSLYNVFNAVLNMPKGNITASSLEDKSKNLKVSDLLGEAFNNKNINEAQLIELKKVYAQNPENLHKLLIEFADMRITYLMGCEWNDLDKSDKGGELKTKYLLGYQWKMFQEFGKKGKPNMDNTINWAIENKVDNFTPDLAGSKFYKDNLQNDLNKLIERVNTNLSTMYMDIKRSGFSSWDSKKTEWVKQNYFQLFNDAYKSHFGITFIENK